MSESCQVIEQEKCCSQSYRLMNSCFGMHSVFHILHLLSFQRPHKGGLSQIPEPILLQVELVVLQLCCI